MVNLFALFFIFVGAIVGISLLFIPSILPTIFIFAGGFSLGVGICKLYDDDEFSEVKNKGKTVKNETDENFGDMIKAIGPFLISFSFFGFFFIFIALLYEFFVFIEFPFCKDLFGCSNLILLYNIFVAFLIVICSFHLSLLVHIPIVKHYKLIILLNKSNKNKGKIKKCKLKQ